MALLAPVAGDGLPRCKQRFWACRGTRGQVGSTLTELILAV